MGEENKPKHSPIGASSMHRWEACPGSVKLSEGLTSEPGKAALEGTMAHELIAWAMEEAFSKNVSTNKVLNEMIEAVTVYSSYIEKLKKDNPVHIELGFDMSSIFPDLYGTADCVIYIIDKKELHVIDYKHGKGLPVEAKGNKQTQYYALGALHTLKYPCKKVHMTIVQPRRYHPEGPIRTWTVPSVHFIDFQADLIRAAKETKKKRAKRVAGDHCIFCLAKNICKEHAAGKLEGAKRTFNYYSDPAVEFEKAENLSDAFDEVKEENLDDMFI